MKILLTGATGFIGSHVCELALRNGVKVFATDRRALACPLLEKARLLWVPGEIDQVPVHILQDCDVVVHLASHGVVAGSNDWESCFEVNVIKSLCLMQRAIAAGVRHFVMCGSCFEYGLSGESYEFIPTHAPLLPTSAYGASKASASVSFLALARQYSVNVVVMRPFQVFGKGEAPERLWSSLVNAASSGADFNMTGGEQIRDFIPVASVARQILGGAIALKTGGNLPPILNIGTGIPLTLREFSETWWSKLRAKGKLCIGALPYRSNEVMRYVPVIDNSITCLIEQLVSE